MEPRIRAINPFRLSDSTLSTLHRCEKLFQITRLYEVDSEYREESAAAIRGKAFGVGVQTYILTGDMQKALYDCWLAYWPIVEDRPNVSCSRTLNSLLVCKDALDNLRDRYEVAIFNGKPAVELSFRLNKKDSQWHYVGYVDIVLFDRIDKIYMVFELKTTGYKLHDLEPVYKNQDQALAYSIVLDAIAGEKQSRYGVLYMVIRDKYKDPIPDIYLFPFHKTLADRLKWFVSYGLELEHLDRMEELGIFPMRGKSCVAFNRVCNFYGSCQMESLLTNPRKQPVQDEEYDFVYDLDEIVEDHLKRVYEAVEFDPQPVNVRWSTE